MDGQDQTNVSSTIVGLMRAQDAHLTLSVAGIVAAKGNVTILNGGSGPVLANGGVTIRNGGCGPMIANGDVSIENGGTQSIIAAGGAKIGPKAFVAFVLSPKVTVEEGGKVLLSTRQALAFGVVCGLVCALGSRIAGRRPARVRGARTER